jgi:peptidoglycan hydrolase-like protein with peptidoglycan-binding domain
MTYVIQPGDTIKSISRKFGISKNSILQANRGIKDPNVLLVGANISIPARQEMDEMMPPEDLLGEVQAVGTCPVLRRGSRGPAVVRLQTLLTTAGFNPGATDGIFGSRTFAAVQAFQAANGLAVDGIVGVQTWTALGVNCQAPPPPPPPPIGACPTLRLGTRGNSVVRLQRLLANAGFNPGPIDGIFGPGTLAAVRAFQASRGLRVDGIVGVQTWTALGVNCQVPTPPPTCPTLRRGSRGPAVVMLQRLLNQRGFNVGPVTGFFGPRTEAAVRAFQGSERIPVTGVVDVVTWTALGVNCQRFY